MKPTTKKTLLTILSLALGMGLSIGLSYAEPYTVNSNGYKAPTQSATAGNTDTPVNVGAAAQCKGDPICNGTGGVFGGLGVKEFIAAQNAEFDATTAFQGLVLGLTDPVILEDSKLAIGDANSTVHLAVTGKEYTQEGGLYSDKIIAPAGELKPLCSDKDGNVIICSVPPPPPAVPVSKDITAKMSFFCEAFRNGNDLKQGYGHVYLYFDNPTPVPFTIRMATCMDNPQLNSAGYLDTCNGVSLIPGGLPSGYQLDSWGPWTMNIPAGVTFWASPSPYWLDDNSKPGDPGQPFYCLNNGKRRNTQVSKVAHAYLELTNPTTGGWTLSFSGTSYQPNFTSPTTFPVTQVP